MLFRSRQTLSHLAQWPPISLSSHSYYSQLLQPFLLVRPPAAGAAPTLRRCRLLKPSSPILSASLPATGPLAPLSVIGSVSRAASAGNASLLYRSTACLSLALWHLMSVTSLFSLSSISPAPISRAPFHLNLVGYIVLGTSISVSQEIACQMLYLLP